MKHVLTLLCCVLFPSLCFAKQINTCHCFQNRSFDAAYPGRADPYLLATAQNSFLSAVFGIDKRNVVQAKMNGSSGADLWVACFAATQTGGDVGLLLSARKSAGSWKEVLVAKNVNISRMGTGFAKAVSADEPDEKLGAIIVDRMLAARMGGEAAQIRKLRQQAATSKEVILVTFLSRRFGREASEYYAMIKAGQSTWDALVQKTGVNPRDMEGEIRKIIR